MSFLKAVSSKLGHEATRAMHTSAASSVVTHLVHSPSLEKASTVASRALVTGATGRLGQTFLPELSKRGIKSICATRSEPRSPDQLRLTYKESVEELTRSIKLHNIDVIVNAAAASSGTLEDMLPVNTLAALRLAEAARRAGIRFVQVSTTATQIPGITEAKPYALSKRLAEQGLVHNDHASIVRLDALLGDDSKIDLSYLAGLGKFFPVSVQLKGIDPVIQPTTYEAASRALAEHVLQLVSNKEGPFEKEINIAGHPVKIREFIRRVSESTLELHVPIAALEGLAKLVNEGALTPEFLKLARKSTETPITFDTRDFERLHGEPIPTVDDLTATVLETVTARSVINAAKRVLGKAPICTLLAETGSILRKASFLLA